MIIRFKILFLLFFMALATFSLLHFKPGLPRITTLPEVVSPEESNPVWIDMMDEPGINIGEVRTIYENYWRTHEHYKGDRSKQFDQWYSINSRRLDRYGKVIPASVVKSELAGLKSDFKGDQSGDWFNYGPVNVGPRNGTKRDGGRVKDIEFHPADPNIFLVSTFKGGLFKTEDYGKSWIPLTDMLIEEVYVSEINNDNPDIIYAGTDLGIIKSENGGLSWSETSVSQLTKALLIRSDNQNIIISGSEDGIRLSIDGGGTWDLVQQASKVEDLDQHPTNPLILYACTNGSPSEFFRSADGGLTWSKNNSFGQGCFMQAAVTPDEPGNVYLINSRDHLGEDSFEGFYLSTDEGINFEKLSGQSPCITGYSNTGDISRGQPNYNLFICVDPTNSQVVYAGGVKSWKSTDGGKTWSHFFEDITTDGDDLHLDQLNWAYSPHDNRIFAVNDGGVYFLDEDNIFNMITDGMPIAEIYECSQSQTKSSNVAGGTMHCGVKLNYNGVWYTPWGGDEATCIIDYSDEKYLYHIKYEKISRSIDGGFSYSNIYPSNTERGYYTGTGILHKGNPNTLFLGLIEVHRTNNARDGSVIWKRISDFGGSEKIQKIEQSSADHSILYVARGNTFYRCENADSDNPVFTSLTSKLPFSGQVNDIATDISNSNILYILLGSRIYTSADRGESWNDITLNLPGIALMEMVVDNHPGGGIYIGTDIGVFYKESSMSEWIDYSKNLPAIRVSGMEIYYGESSAESFITISTDGRGFWRSPLYGNSIAAPVAEFTADRTEIGAGTTVTFNSSGGNLSNYKWIFEGGVPSESIDINPRVLYKLPGTYPVSLAVSNSSGSDEILINNYITVVDQSALGSLQLNYTFDTDFTDASPYYRDADILGMVTIEYDGIARFDGSGYLKAKDYKGIAGSEARSGMAWIKTTSPEKSILAWGIAATSKKVNFRTELTGQLRFEIGGGYIIGTKDVCDGKWHHVVFTFENDGFPDVQDVKLYVDGLPEEISEVSPVDLNTEEGSELMVGNDQLGRKFIGWMDDIRLYNIAIAAGDISEIVANLPTNMNLVAEEYKIKIYSESRRIVVENRLGLTGEIIISDLHGRVIGKNTIAEGLNYFNPGKGLYLVTCRFGSSSQTKKIMIK